MKRKTSLSLLLTLMWSLVTLPVITQAAPPQRFRADFGVVTPGAGQILRITVSPSTIPNGAAAGDIRVRIKWMQYGPQGCSGMPAVCRHMILSQGASPAETLGPDDALSFDLQGSEQQHGVRVVVESNSPNARVIGMIIDSSTQRIISTLVQADFLWDLG